MGIERVKQGVKEHITEFLTRSANPPPLLFFTLYVYTHLGIQSPDYVAYTFFTVGLIFSLVFRFNHFYIYSPILNNGIGYLSILNLALGLLAANEKWKLYLFLFIIGDSITIEYTELTALYRICCCLYLAIDVYRNMIFGSIKDNLWFFTGFMTIFIFELFAKLIQSVQGYQGIPYFTIPFALLMSYKLITARVDNLKKQPISKLRNVQLMSHYISLIQTQIQSPYARQGFLQSHKQSCNDLHCFCRNNDIMLAQSDQQNKQLGMKLKSKLQYYFLRSLYEKGLQQKSLPKKELLYNKFISFLLDNNQLTEAIELYTKLQVLQAKFYYFRWVQRTQLLYKIKSKLFQFEYFNPFSKQFLYVFEYDNSYLYLASEIKDILKLKVQFWKQVGKQNPLMVDLQAKGSEIVQRMYELNNFYYKQIKQQQQKINNFNGTIVYAMYLLSTTNYKQFAQSLIKNTSRTLQSIKIHQDNIAETYGLKIVIRDSKNSCNQRIETLDSLIQPDEIDQVINEGQYYGLISQKEKRIKKKKVMQFYQDGFIQIITNISGSLCKLLESTKNEIIGRDLNMIIPNSYQQRHHTKVGQILHFDSNVNKQIVNLSFINKIRQVPMKTADGKLISARVSVKLYEGLEDGVSFVAVVQTINQNKVTVISDLEGKIEECEQGLTSLNILQHQQVKKVIEQLKQQWLSQSSISTKKINLSFIDNNYSITFSSPYQFSFIKDKLKNKDQEGVQQQDEGRRLIRKKSFDEKVTKSPPLHIDVVNESIPYLTNLRQDRQQQMTKCIKKMQSVFYKTDIDSQSSTNSSRKSSVVNVLMSFSQNYFIPFYGYIMGVFGLVLIGAIVANSIGLTQLGLGWDNSAQMKNPIINLVSLMNMRNMLIDTVSNNLDLTQYNSNPLINKTYVDSFYGIQSNSSYPNYLQQFMGRNKLRYKQSVSSVSMYLADLLKDNFGVQVQTTIVTTTNPTNPQKAKATQRLPLQNVLMNYLVDLDLLSRGKPYNRTIISYNFLQVEYILSQVDYIVQIISDAISKSVLYNIIYCSIVAIVFLFSIIPIYYLLKKRVKRHIDIYDLIVSVQGQLVKDEIKKLYSIIMIVNNSNESSQILKTNTINYLARKRSSAVNDGAGASNQMIEGLIQVKNDSIDEDHQLRSILMDEEQLQLQTDNSGKFIKKPLNASGSKLAPYFNQKHNDEIVCEDKLKLQLRKRSGELDLTSSQGDFKRVVIKHWLLYFMIILSVFTLVAITACKASNYNQVDSTYKQLLKGYNTFIDEALLLLNAKIFFRGMANSQISYHDETFIKYLNNRIYENNIIKSDMPAEYAQVIPPCRNTNFKYCQQQYSLLTLRQQVNHFIKQSYEVRLNINTKYNCTNTNMTMVPKQQLKAFSQYFFYAQSMRGQIANISNVYRLAIINQMLTNHTELLSRLDIIFIIGLIYTVLALIIGLCLINWMKKLYFREIIIVSFLNNQMISRNKRVQSFLETLSKSSY